MRTAQISTGECVHYWLIDTPEGPTSTGKCKYCGMEREFNNTWADSFNEHQIVSDKSRTSTPEPVEAAV